MKKYEYKGLEIWKIKGGFDMIRCKAGVFMYCLTGWTQTWKLYPPADSRMHIRIFESERMLLDFVVNLNENTNVNHCTEETETIIL